MSINAPARCGGACEKKTNNEQTTKVRRFENAKPNSWPKNHKSTIGGRARKQPHEVEIRRTMMQRRMFKQTRGDTTHTRCRRHVCNDEENQNRDQDKNRGGDGDGHGKPRPMPRSKSTPRPRHICRRRPSTRSKPR